MASYNTDERLMSEVKLRKNEVKIGTKLNYVDSCNFMSYEVISIDADLDWFEAKDLETNECDYYWFNELQHGWRF